MHEEEVCSIIGFSTKYTTDHHLIKILAIHAHSNPFGISHKCHQVGFKLSVSFLFLYLFREMNFFLLHKRNYHRNFLPKKVHLNIHNRGFPVNTQMSKKLKMNVLSSELSFTIFPFI